MAIFSTIKRRGFLAACFLGLALLCVPASAALTPAQLTTLRNFILANGPMNAQPNNSDGNTEVARLLNLAVVPDFWVWRTRVTKAELTNSTSIDSTVFAWTGTGFITRSVGERDAWRELFDASEALNPSLPQVRQAFTDIFSGATAPAPANRTHLSTVSRRKASVIEKLLATGTGSTASPALMGYEGPVNAQEVETARNM